MQLLEDLGGIDDDDVMSGAGISNVVFVGQLQQSSREYRESRYGACHITAKLREDHHDYTHSPVIWMWQSN
jgi:hypothetical protein